MVKVRMNTADVAAEVKCLRGLIGMRCANIYDISPKTYLFKLMNSSGISESGESERVLLMMESGIRFHTTQYVRDKNTTPSGFTLKLRKHIRTKRLEDVRQLGFDRIILLQFGLGTSAHFVILELYAQGNILLTDSEFMVMTLLRSHRDDDKGLAIMSCHQYPVASCRVLERSSFMTLKIAFTSLRQANEKCSAVEGACNDTSDGKKSSASKTQNRTDAYKRTSDGDRFSISTLKSILGGILNYGPALSEHIILDAGMLPNMKIGIANEIDDEAIQALALAVGRFEDWLEGVISGNKIPEGFILMQQKVSGKKDAGLFKESNSEEVYDEFCPLLLNQFKSRGCMKFETFDSALDEFYSKIESQRTEQQQKAKEGTAIQKLNKIRLDQENRVQTLKKEVDHSVKMAELIEYNLADVDAAILAVRVELANGMDWVDLARMVKDERKAGNPVAGLIDKLHLERNSITLFLSNNLDEMDDDEKTSPVDKVEVDLSLSAHANARRWFEMKKKHETKQEKTIIAHEMAFKAAEKKTRLQLAQEKSVAAITHIRKVHWFEKFNWFISSENYLIISGRDAQQNEMIVKRYMSKGDLYVHADLHGASSTIIKNHKQDHPIPPLTLNQAGCFTVCHSQAWNSKIVTSAWWVYPHQVSKTAPTGEYLTVGSFMVRGKKNFLPPHPLVMGFSILFRLDESSLGPHLNERRVRGDDENQDGMEGESHKEQSDSDSDGEITGTNEEFSCPSKSGEAHVDAGSERLLEVGSVPAGTHSLNAGNSYHHEDIIRDEESEQRISDGGSLDYKERRVQPVPYELEALLDKTLGFGPAKFSDKNSVIDESNLEVDYDFEGRKDYVRGKAYISKAERRKLKKGQISINGTANELLEKDAIYESISRHQPEKGSENLKFQKTSRGQKGKLKKIKEKYSEQDDEERNIRMALLASAGSSKKEKVSQDRKGAPGKSMNPVSEGQSDSSKICYKCKKAGHLSRDCPEWSLENNHPQVVLDNHVNGHLSTDSPGAELDELSNLDMVATNEDDVHEAEQEKQKLNDLDYLTGNPLSDDILLYAVPVCGPYNAFQSCKFRAKITPGNLKKGKAAKAAMNLFSHMPEVTNREKELMKACTDPELVAVIVGNAKITAPGLTQLKQKQKKGKKSAKCS